MISFENIKNQVNEKKKKIEKCILVENLVLELYNIII